MARPGWDPLEVAHEFGGRCISGEELVVQSLAPETQPPRLPLLPPTAETAVWEERLAWSPQLIAGCTF